MNKCTKLVLAARLLAPLKDIILHIATFQNLKSK